MNFYRQRLNIHSNGRSYVISVSFDLNNAEMAAQIVNRHVQAYLDQQRAEKNVAIAGATEWLAREVNQLSIRLNEQRSAVQSFRASHKLPANGGVALFQARLADTQANLTRLHDGLVAKQARLAQLQRGGGTTDFGISPNLSKMRADEVEATRLLAQQQTAGGVTNPMALQLRAGIATLQQAIQAELQRVRQEFAAEVNVDQQSEAVLDKEIDTLRNALLVAERDQTVVESMERDANVTRSLYETLLKKQREVFTQIGIQQPDAHVVSWASSPLQPAFPNRALLMAGWLAFVLASGFGLVLALQYLRPRIDALEDLDASLGFRALGAVPNVQSRRNRHDLALPGIVIQQPGSLAAECLRSVRASLSTRGRGVPQTLAITSALPREGKTSVALALARSLTASGLSVLLIEADLRRGYLARLVWQTSAPRAGLVGLLTRNVPLAKAVREDALSSLHILAAEAQPIAPQDMIGPVRLRSLLEEARASYDYVIIDTPPVNAVADALFVAQAVAATIIVVHARRTPVPAVSAALQSLRDAGVSEIGAVLNRVDPLRIFRRGPAYGGFESHAKRTNKHDEEQAVSV